MTIEKECPVKILHIISLHQTPPPKDASHGKDFHGSQCSFGMYICFITMDIHTMSKSQGSKG